MFTCYFLKQLLHNYGVYKKTGKEKAQQPPLHHREHRANCTKSHLASTPVAVGSRPGSGMIGQCTLCNSQLEQNTEDVKVKLCKGNPSLFDNIMPRGENKYFKTPCGWLKTDRVPSISK